MKSKLTTVIVAFLWVMLAFANISTAKSSVVMATGEWPPYTTEASDNYGFFTEIVTAVFDEMEITPNYKFFPWKRCAKMVKDGNAWAAFPYTPNDERKETFAFSDVVATSRSVFFFVDEKLKNTSWEKLEDLKPYDIGGVGGYFYEEAFENAGLDVDYASKEIVGFKKLLRGRLDFFPVNELVGWELVKDNFPNKVDELDTLDKPLSTSPLSLMVLKSDQESIQLLKKFDAALQKIKDKGIYKNILDKYLFNQPE